jgi:DNA-binding response OmpR family regulator
VVEDDETLRKFCLWVLRSKRYRILEAFDGKVGLAMFLRHREEVDLVVADIVMPHSGMDADAATSAT